MAARGEKEKRFHFTVPEGVQPGDLVELLTPSGVRIEVVVPTKAEVGSSFQISYPKSYDEEGPKSEIAEIAVEVPKGAIPGQIIKGQTPSGREFDAVVPKGVKGGRSFMIHASMDDVVLPTPTGSKGTAGPPEQPPEESEPMLAEPPIEPEPEEPPDEEETADDVEEPAEPEPDEPAEPDEAEVEAEPNIPDEPEPDEPMGDETADEPEEPPPKPPPPKAPARAMRHRV